MKNLILALVAIAAVAWSAGLLSSDEPSGGDVQFVKGIDAGLEQARTESKPAMLYFTADW